MAVNERNTQTPGWLRGEEAPRTRRRDFLLVLAGLAAGPVVPSAAAARWGRGLLSLREADFQRPHDLAG